MTLDIVPLEAHLIDAAAELLRNNYMLQNVEAAIQTELARPYSRGVAAMENKRLVGYMIGHEILEGLMARSGWIRLAGHAVATPAPTRIYHELYSVLAADWVRDGCFNHYVMTAANDSDKLDAWFTLGFGKQQVYADLLLDHLLVFENLPTHLDIRRATPADQQHVYQLADTILRHQAQSPVFAPTTPEYTAEVRQGYVDLIEDESAIFWLAFKGEHAVGYQVYFPVPNDETDLLNEPNRIELSVAGTVMAARGMGVGRALTQQGLTFARQQGYEICITDWRTTNLSASQFWQQVGFSPRVYRLCSRLDPRIAWAKV